MGAGRLEDVLLAAGGGDRVAFQELYDAIAHRVFGLSRRLLRDTCAAEDVTQEVLMSIWTQGARYDADRGSAIAWILRITHARAVDRIRAAESTRRRDDALHRRSLGTDHDDTAEAAVLSLEGRDASRALATLSEVQRAALTLAYFDGLTHTQVADRLGVPLGTAKTRIRDGLGALRRALPLEAPVPLGATEVAGAA